MKILRIVAYLFKGLLKNWQKIAFAAFGFVTLYFCVLYLMSDKITNAAAAFGMAFLSFIYSNLSQFKKFKGLGFEAELWEDKQKEAAALIDRLKNVVSIYSHQIIKTNILRGRLDSGGKWKETWKLLDDLSEQHNVLGQRIDFSELKKFADDYFLLDLCYNNCGKSQQAIRSGVEAARATIDAEARLTIVDTAKIDRMKIQLIQVKYAPEGRPLEISSRSNLAKVYIDIFIDAQTALKRDFDVDITFDSDEFARLNTISYLYEHRPVKVTEELIDWATYQ